MQDLKPVDMDRRRSQAPAPDPAIVQAAIDEARDSNVDVAEVSLERVARRVGVSRATLFRRIRTRDVLDEAVRRKGVDPGRKETVRDRALAAALELMESRGLDGITLEEVARRAGCAVTSVHTQFGGRDGLLEALFDRFSPIARVERVLENRPERFEDQVRAIYEAFYDVAVKRTAVAPALFASILGRPEGPTAAFARRTVAPRVLGHIGSWLAEEASKGQCRELPPSLAIPILLGPLIIHMVTRSVLERAGAEVPDRDSAVQALTDAFCRGVRVSAGPAS